MLLQSYTVRIWPTNHFRPTWVSNIKCVSFVSVEWDKRMYVRYVSWNGPVLVMDGASKNKYLNISNIYNLPGSSALILHCRQYSPLGCWCHLSRTHQSTFKQTLLIYNKSKYFQTDTTYLEQTKILSNKCHLSRTNQSTFKQMPLI